MGDPGADLAPGTRNAINRYLAGLRAGAQVSREDIRSYIDMHVPKPARPVRASFRQQAAHYARYGNRSANQGDRRSRSARNHLKYLERAGAIKRIGETHVMIMDPLLIPGVVDGD